MAKTEEDDRCKICKVCFRSFRHQSNLVRHMKMHQKGDSKSSSKIHECKYCSKSFTRTDHLSSHMKIHTSEEPYVCTVCRPNKRFRHKRSWSRHVQNHHEDRKLYKCKLCDRAYKWKESLSRHLKTHVKMEETKEQKEIRKPKYPCNDCGKSFMRKSNLGRHASVHTRIKPYLCTICLKGFRYDCERQKHIISHMK